MSSSPTRPQRPQPRLSHHAPRPANRPVTGRPVTNRQVRWQSSQPQWGHNPFMLDDFDDIPVAVREDDGHPKRRGSTARLALVLGGIAAAGGLFLGALAAMFEAEPGGVAASVAALWPGGAGAAGERGGEPAGNSASGLPLNADLAPSSGPFITSPASSQASSQDLAAPEGEMAEADARQGATILGHYPYAEAPQTALVELAGTGVKLQPVTAEAFEKMRKAALAEGISLVPLSGFRSVETQKDLFFNVKAERGQTASERAKVSAPPGHSEHHTGYAIDIGDGRDASTNLSDRFEATPAFAWLQKNAPYYSFELSFPRDNPQGVNYEPWHWRYVGDQASLELFHRDR